MNPRLAKTKESLLEALIRMLEEVPLESITVSDLCKEAGINRTTFYKYYSVPEDVITEVAERILDEVIYRAEENERTVYDYMLVCCNAFLQYRGLMSAYVRSSGNISHMMYIPAVLCVQHFQTVIIVHDVDQAQQPDQSELIIVQFEWQESNGDNRYYTEHICGNFYYYEASF